MSLRKTLTAMFFLVTLCAGSLYAVNAYFSRDSQMRQSERDFVTANGDEIVAAQARLDNDSGGSADGTWAAADDTREYGDAEAPSLDEWYAEAGTSDEPFVPEPEDKSHLINDAKPYSDAEPVG